jgi:transcriptional regulator with XRE-family HTH domain
MAYHYGMTIREYRERAGMTQAQLAERWPSREGGVSADYISLVENGKKHITDVVTLRQVCRLLSIPTWKVGLADYDPFESVLESAGSMYDYTLKTASDLIKRTWWMRRTAPLSYVEEAVADIDALFAYLGEHMPPPARLRTEYQALYAQTLRLNAVLDVEHQRYDAALAKFEQMVAIGRAIDHPATLAIALLGRGTELSRANRHSEAIESLEEARDESFQASRHVMAICNAYLARAYSAPGPQFAAEFKRAIAVAQRIAASIQMSYGDGTDFVFHSYSGILAEKSYGYLEILEPQVTLDMREEITAQIQLEGNRWLDAWIPLDWSRASIMLGQIEEGVEAARLFYRRVTALGSPHARSRAAKLLATMRAAGFGEHPTVQAFASELDLAGIQSDMEPYPLL